MYGTHRFPIILPVALMLIGAIACVGVTTVGVSIPNTLDGGDGFLTTGGGTISAGGARTATLNSLTEAHNWAFEGEPGQTVTVQVIGHPPPARPLLDWLDTQNWSWQRRLPVYYPPTRPTTTDPRVKLLDPRGIAIAEDDDSGGGLGGWDSLLTATLTQAGSYTLRVDVYSIGTYTIEFDTD